MFTIGEKFWRYNKYILYSVVGKGILEARGGKLCLKGVCLVVKLSRGGLGVFILIVNLIGLRRTLEISKAITY